VDVVGGGDDDVGVLETGVDEMEDAFGTENGDEIGGDEGGGGRGNSKISTTFECTPLFKPHPKNILF
jgi:hypothetical protein